MTKATPITDKVTLKLYGDRKTQEEIIQLLTEHGFVYKGRISEGNPYTTQKGTSGWASNVTVIKTDDSDP